ncbi:hypothetical protein [Alloactinosynnema sp. L-07]|uniref:hypothetical protein n=1 Tax=Alloactinosynnema sp. L-07 TaxID=1653480 RepID=UPI00065F024A|nr:hypothetical protein [Alloactinosynnema sp. L-07]CRK56992.1 hypothetical protein [Alloactinosynnema sp. L-07]
MVRSYLCLPAIAVCHQLCTAEEAQILMDYLEAGPGARLSFQLIGLSLPVAGVRIPVDPLHVTFTRARISNSAEVTDALERGENVVPVDIGPAPGSPVLGRSSPDVDPVTEADG